MFYAASVLGLFTHLIGDTGRYRWYKVISSSHNVKFYLDVEALIDSSLWQRAFGMCRKGNVCLVDMGLMVMR
jgi:hypothetical protein